MGMWSAIALIVVIAVAADAWVKVQRAKAKKSVNDEDAEAMLARIDTLEDRIQVLERIVTEDKHDLRKEISRL